MSTYRWVLFDADHTLFDFDRASEEALAAVLARHGETWAPGMYPEYKRINTECWNEYEQGRMSRDTLVYERFRRYFEYRKLNLDPVSTQQEYLEQLGARPYPMPGAHEILDFLTQRVGLGYITNGMSKVQRPRLDLIGWTSRFDVIVIAGEIGASKPHPDYFRHVHQEIGTPDHSEVLVVGDSLSADISGAAAFGYHTCWYNPAGDPCDLEQGPDYTIAHLDELRNLFPVDPVAG